jgi:hypothetical protein
MVQHLLPGDYAKRVRFCEWLQPRLHILRDFLFTDDAHFIRMVIANTRNEHSWGHENPHEVAERNFQRRYSVNVWCEVLSTNLIGPYYRQSSTATYYKNFLENGLPLHSEAMSLAT